MKALRRTTTVFIYAAALLSIAACNTQSTSETDAIKDSFNIKVNIKNTHDGFAKLSYRSPDFRDNKLLDSVVVKNGQFVFTGKLKQPGMLLVQVEPGGWNFDVFAENADITVEGDTTGSQYFDQIKYGGTKWAALKNFVVKGSASQEAWLTYVNDPALKKYDSMLTGLYAKAENKLDEETRSRYSNEVDSIKNLQTTGQLNWIDSYAKQHPASVAGAYIFSQVYLFNESNLRLSQVDSLLQNFSGVARSSDYYKYIAGNYAKRKALTPGNMAPDFTLLKRDSSTFKLSSLRGKYVLIDFWASWCHPCRQAIPHWKKVYEEFRVKGFEIVSVSDDARWSDWRKAMDVEKMPWTQVCDEFPDKNMPARVGSLYMTTFIPFYVLLDKEGKILVYSGDENAATGKLKELLEGSPLAGK